MWKICLYFFTLILFSCNNHSAQNKEWAHTTIRIDPLKATTTGYSTVFDSVEYIPILSDSAFLLGEIDKMIVANNYIFLMDKYITKSVFAFDRQGENKTVINKQGNGPGEYVAIKDFYFDEKQDAIGIYCAMRKKLIYYDMHGQYIRLFPDIT
jgi:hypothetical protein